MKEQRGLKHYLIYYAFTMVIYIAYVIWTGYQAGEYSSVGLWSIAYIPLLFIGFLFLFNTILDKIFPPKDTHVQDEFTVFLKTVTTAVNTESNFTIEEFNRLKDSERFQKVLFQTFQIHQNGETEEYNFRKIEKRFKKDTLEYRAASIVVDEVKQMMIN